MIYQTDPEFPPDIQHYGCYFLSLLFQLDRLLSLSIMDHKIITAIYEAEETDLDLGPECFINDPQGICNHVARARVHYLGKYSASYLPKPTEFEIHRWYNPSTESAHFVAGDAGKVIYDPYSAIGSRTVREGFIESKRIFEII